VKKKAVPSLPAKKRGRITDMPMTGNDKRGGEKRGEAYPVILAVRGGGEKGGKGRFWAKKEGKNRPEVIHLSASEKGEKKRGYRPPSKGIGGRWGRKTYFWQIFWKGRKSLAGFGES